MVITCQNCGSDKVQTKMWVECNTNIVINEADSQGEDSEDNWCPNCGHCNLEVR